MKKQVTKRKPKRKPKRRYERVLWGGFTRGRLGTVSVYTIGEFPAVFDSRKKARRLFDDVRKVSVVEEGK